MDYFAISCFFYIFASMTIKEYIAELNRQLATGMAREHSYRPALKQLLDTLLPDFDVTNEPSRIACGAPDFIIMRRRDRQPTAFVETKDLGDTDLDGRRQHREQFARYRKSLDHIVFTDYLDFHFYHNGELSESIRIAELRGDKVVAIKDNIDRWATAMRRLATAGPQRIVAARQLASAMAAKAVLMGNILTQSLEDERPDDKPDTACSQLAIEYKAFKDVLISTLTYDEFADIYSQTIVYGMFAARLNDPTPDTFSRFEAASLIPKTNPFLRKVFQNIAGYDLDERLTWIVDDVAAMFNAADLDRIMQGYGGNGKPRDPMIHFYEDFLMAYRPAVRKEKGVWYTPLPVVRFMVDAVDSVLRSDFGLPLGLADYSTVEREVVNPQHTKGRHGSRTTYAVTFHKVQILDPATGTGTFLAEMVNAIHDRFHSQQGLWQDYVAHHLLPRLNGFELLMAPYTIAHLKLDMILRATGYSHNSDARLRIFLTNSLEECHPYTGTLFAKWLSDEANAANRIKRDTPVMVMIGNPPYNGESQNKGEWIMNLMETYKKEPGGKAKLNERNPKWLNDDYVKFIRMAQHFIEKNCEGVLAFINPHGFLDNPTFRGMRWQLLRAFDKIYTIDLHGNSKKKETAPDGGKDENVFDIQQGVSINIFVKNNHKKTRELGRVYHFDLFGKRQDKFDFLASNTLLGIHFTEVRPQEPMYFFLPKDTEAEEEYNNGFGVNELFSTCLLGPNSHRDDFAIAFDRDTARKRIEDFANKDITDDEIIRKYNLKNNRDWNVTDARKQMTGNEIAIKCLYRPFDFRYMLYGSYAFDYPRPQINDSLLKPNIALITTRQTKEKFAAMVCSTPLGQHKIVTPYDGSYVMPLYSHNETGLFKPESDARKANFNSGILSKIKQSIEEKDSNIAPMELFDYIYAVLHSPQYRKRYKEFLKIDFPKIPYPKDAKLYHALAEKGGELRRLHLMESSEGWPVTATYPVAGTNVVEQLRREADRVYINKEQYIGGVSNTAWLFCIGGYQPAQKWLKDRRGRTLGFKDIRHYQEIIHALDNTARLMNEIDGLWQPGK